jgi:outer membrane protein assembly factor BamB
VRCTLLLAAMLAAPAVLAADNWPAFRGPKGDGHTDATGLPVTWSEKENVRWKTPIHGKAWSSPVVWGNQVWVTTATPDGKELSALAVDLATGKVLLDRKVFEIAKPAFCIATNSYASSTPCIEAGRIYVHYGSAGTACLDTATGKVVWSRQDLPCDHWRGPGSSPILYRDLLLVHFDGHDLQYVVALDKYTGRTVWRKDRSFEYGKLDGDLKKAYGTPAVLDVGGKPQLVSPAAFGTIAYDPLTGEEIWKVRHGGMNAAAPPLYGQGLVYLRTGDGGLGLLAVRPDGKGDVTESHIAWKIEHKQGTMHASPLLVDDRLYAVNQAGIFSCLAARTGKELWKERLAGKFWASPLYAAGRIYLCNEDGVTCVGDVREGWKLLATNKLDDGFMASPAVAGNALILRTRSHLYCIAAKE